ncbi:MAG: phosphate ABC transporter permease subunit PstC [Anaerolineae bacterium]|nr:phosphate ABC transporter permease subunit PstC [Anaerolineae bacterium]
MATSKTALRTDAGADVRADVRLALRKRRRPHETVIQGLLFLCGAVSILTTLGIAFGLVQESLSFFTRELWEDANKRLAVEVDAQASTLQLSSGGLDLGPDDVIRIDDEKMRIVQAQGKVLTVERGFQGTAAATHQAGTGLFVSDRVSLIEFFTGTRWNPQIGQFGIWPLVVSTLRTSTIAVLVAMPLGLSVAIYLSEYASSRARSILKPVLEVLSGIPTVVYGYFALVFMTQLLRSLLGADTVQIYNTASAGIVIGILILPLVSSMSEDALSAVPRSLREGAYAMGATKWETAVKVVVPAALSGIAAAFIVSISRAIGETMIVAIAAGAGPNFTLNPFDAAETMTGHIVRISGGDLSYDSIDYNSIFAIGLVLFLMTLGLNVVSQRIVRKFREVYE